MREPRHQRPEPPPWHVPVARDDIDENGKHFALEAGDAERAAVAGLAGLRALPRLHADFDVTRQGAGLRVRGRLVATVGQTCVVTLEPLTNEIDESVDLLFMPAPAADSGEAASSEAAAEPKWDDPEPLVGGVVDLGAIATEFLVLGLDPYPRKAGAKFEPPPQRQGDESPFAGLAGLAKKRNDR